MNTYPCQRLARLSQLQTNYLKTKHNNRASAFATKHRFLEPTKLHEEEPVGLQDGAQHAAEAQQQAQTCTLCTHFLFLGKVQGEQRCNPILHVLEAHGAPRQAAAEIYHKTKCWAHARDTQEGQRLLLGL